MKRTWLLLLGGACLGSLAVLLLEQKLAPQIQAQQQQAQERRLLDLLPPEYYNNHPLQNPIALAAGGLLGLSRPSYGYIARYNEQPVAWLIPVEAKGYAGPILLLVAIAPNGSILSSKILHQQETPGLGERLRPERSPWLKQFEQKSLQDPWLLRVDGGVIDQISGATITSRATTDALQRVLRYYNSHAGSWEAND